MPIPPSQRPGTRLPARGLATLSSVLREAEFLVCSHFSMLGLALSGASLCLTLSLSPLGLYVP